ncbi:MAG: cob(I)yrinic acid a,c-diamide adenosyltransferase [Deltaproteobacteria bacterium]|nr:cob(I)yrinic acid a,c-diamide adenosyltransferase [Deltaproteobacteria bacterium]
MKKGLIQIYTGEGKGKTTASIGLAVRAAGQGKRVLFVQFFKEDDVQSGEKEIFRNQISQIELIRSNVRHPMFTKGRTNEAALRASIEDTFKTVRERIGEGGVDLLVLDEMNSVLSGGWIPVEEMEEFLRGRPEGLEVVLTGRDAPVELVKMADYVTEMLKIKHPFDEGVKARKGIEF